ncbi:hypothetical protein [uncultured Deefgea sp.]|uniref:hypothetical protein n=1 Tax=uncultured Deefgea sp. TaxID=1304914 RepID=UPI00262BBC9D|nr:hypothetical protein [uncultured Deefgea sp.]
MLKPVRASTYFLKTLYEVVVLQASSTVSDELCNLVIPNLQSHPYLGGNFLLRSIGSIEVKNVTSTLQLSLAAYPDATLHEYRMQNHILLYLVNAEEIILLSIQPYAQLSKDFLALWQPLPQLA